MSIISTAPASTTYAGKEQITSVPTVKRLTNARITVLEALLTPKQREQLDKKAKE